MSLRVAGFLPCSELNGPGRRAVVWLQGCPRSPPCAGCFNPQMLPLESDAAQTVTVEALAGRILACDDIAGATLSGGEPFLQAGEAAQLARRLRAAGLTVTLFTGYTLEALRAAGRADWLALLAEADLLIDGPYDATRPCDHPLRSSTNQRLRFLSGRIDEREVEQLPHANLEIVIGADSTVLTGLSDPDILL